MIAICISFWMAMSLAAAGDRAEHDPGSAGSQSEVFAKTVAESDGTATPAAAHASDSVVDDIMRLRDANEDVFAGTVFERLLPSSPAVRNAEFRAALERVVAQSKTAIPPPSEATPAVAGAPADDQLVSTLRLAGRLLDDKANDLETQRQYAEADELRVLATRVRTMARHADAHGAAEPAQR